jgi:class 3 adenylate cyclase
VVDFTALGDSVNTAARLASAAGAGELLLSESV